MSGLRIARQIIPLVCTTVQATTVVLMYLEVCNPTEAPVTFGAWDMEGLCVIPSQPIQAGGMLTYEAKFGNLLSGLRWQASAPGLIGWAQGE